MEHGTNKRAPRKEDAFDLLMRAFDTESSTDAILAQESDGQRSLVSSDTLPSKGDARPVLEAAGVKYIGPVAGDPLFQYVELPPGWQKVPSDHAMWSYLTDDKGRTRASIFYKAASYDRDAFVNASRRFSWRIDYDLLDKGTAQAVITDCGKEIHRTTGIDFDANGERDLRYAASDAAKADAKAWMDEHYPEWEKDGAYWDDES